jgi:hypothetical protein
MDERHLVFLVIMLLLLTFLINRLNRAYAGLGIVSGIIKAFLLDRKIKRYPEKIPELIRVYE